MEKLIKNSISPLFDGLINMICIKTQRLTVTPIVKDDEKAYYDLYTDEKLNEFWGYDYKKDLPIDPTPTDFYEFMISLKEKGEEISFAVRLNGVMIGELVAYNFSNMPSCEVGYRFFKKYHGKGYAIESASALIDYIVNNLGAKAVFTRCFKQNTPSYNLAKKLGYTLYSEDKTHYYFIKVIN
ncbi:MAG: GNAT family N-acetyltransferase [Clostridia bacterium]|nr:GNAT family N-acetyltransferase [Clostridia bacterium]